MLMIVGQGGVCPRHRVWKMRDSREDDISPDSRPDDVGNSPLPTSSTSIRMVASLQLTNQELLLLNARVRVVTTAGRLCLIMKTGSRA